jgi:15-cis-phytoene synthase
VNPIEDLSILDNFEECQSYTRRHARSFYFASFVLPKEKRMAAYALYAFCRYADNIVDSTPTRSDGATAQDRLGSLRELLLNLYDQPDRSPEQFRAFRETVARYSIPKEYFLDLLRGVEMDLTKKRYGTFTELHEYCYCVASVVGLMMTRVFGAAEPSALSYASDLGTAMQLTNILRDVREDFAMGRIYIPADELRAFGCTEDDLAANHCSPQFRKLMIFQIARARWYYARAHRGIPLLTDDGSRFCARLMSDIYSTILDRIEEYNYDVFSTRVFVPFSQKLRIAAMVALGAPATYGTAGTVDDNLAQSEHVIARDVGTASAR